MALRARARRDLTWRRLAGIALTTFVVYIALPESVEAQKHDYSEADVVCSSKSDERQTCAADTKGGVTLLGTIGGVACELGKTWGYDQRSIWVSDGCSGAFDVGRATKESFGTYTPLKGFRIADTDRGDVNIDVYTYVRYLNQLGLSDSARNDFGFRSRLDLRQDILFQKVIIYVSGWILDPRFNYLTYSWTSNASQGLGAQVVIGGNLTYKFNKYIALGGGINALPGVRATEGQFPLWLSVDNRLMADEFFRPSYSMGIWAKGEVVPRLTYYAMLANNLSQLGVDAGQLDKDLSTWTAALIWEPTTGEFGTNGAFGDFDFHERLATRLGGHVTMSDENFQGQGNADQFENVQIRLSNGSIIFVPDLFGPGIRVSDAWYQMMSWDMGFKYRGFSWESEYYWRWVSNFRGPGTDTLDELWDHGFQTQASVTIKPKLFQLYVSGSKVFGQFGDPSDFRVGVNWYPQKSQVMRWNAEYLYLNRSPVGGLSLPYPVRGNGPVFYTSFELNL